MNKQRLQARLANAVRPLVAALLTIVVGGFLAATVALSESASLDEQSDLDERLHADSLEAIREEKVVSTGLLHFYWHYMERLAAGDLGTSRAFNRPIRELFAEGLPVTLGVAAEGLAGAWLLGFLLALCAVEIHHRVVDWLANALSRDTLSFTVVAVAALLIYLGWGAAAIVAIVVLPRVFQELRGLLTEILSLPAVEAVRTKGLSRQAVFLRFVLPRAAPRMIDLLGSTFKVAFIAAVPIEALAGSTGMGHLAREGAVTSDLQLLVSLAVVMTVVMVLAKGLVDAALDELRVTGAARK